MRAVASQVQLVPFNGWMFDGETREFNVVLSGGRSERKFPN